MSLQPVALRGEKERVDQMVADQARSGLREAVIYLANAWTSAGTGLFHPRF